MSRSDSRAEVAKLARLLRTEGERPLQYLEGVPAEELREYREGVVDLLYDDDRELLGRMAEAARLLPTRTLAMVGERALGPLTCAHLTGLLDPRRAAEIAQHFSVGFLACLAAELDPRRSVEVVTSTPSELVVEIALEMAAQGEYVAMGRFVAHLDDDTLDACLRRFSEQDVLRVSFVLEGERPHERTFRLLGAERMREILDRAEALGLSEEAEHLRAHLKPAQRKQL